MSENKLFVIVIVIMEKSYVRGSVSLMEREWSCYGGGQFNGGRMIIREVVSFIEGEWSFYRGVQFKGGRMVMLHFNRRENGHVKEVVFNGGSMVMLQRRSV